MVESTGLENRQGFMLFVGSNPTPSAIICIRSGLAAAYGQAIRSGASPVEAYPRDRQVGLEGAADRDQPQATEPRGIEGRCTPVRGEAGKRQSERRP